jgi:hypothetical protein
MKNIIIVVLVVAALVWVALSYDMDKDPSMHNCTQACALEGCPFGE